MFGKRKPFDKRRISENVYSFIKSKNLGSLSALSEIPEFLLQSLLLYIIQVSSALKHAHEHGLVHGNFNLSKTLFQRCNHDSSAST